MTLKKIENGEIVIIENQKVSSIKPFPKQKARPCIFEYIYFARPDSLIDQQTVYTYRKNLGEQLVLSMFPSTFGSASKGGMAFDNKTLDEDKNIQEAKEIKFINLNGSKECIKCKKKCPTFQQICVF